MALAQQNLIVYRDCEEYTACPTNVFEVEVADALSIGDTGLVEAKLAQYDGSSIQAATLHTVQSIWKDYLTTGAGISPLDSITLFDIACSDPIAYGSGVYVARNILDWSGDCPQTSAIFTAVQPSNQIAESTILSPNPNNGRFKIDFPENASDCWLLTIGGQSIQRIDVRSMEFDLMLESGTYILKILMSDGSTEVIRFVVI